MRPPPPKFGEGTPTSMALPQNREILGGLQCSILQKKVKLWGGGMNIQKNWLKCKTHSFNHLMPKTFATRGTIFPF